MRPNKRVSRSHCVSLTLSILVFIAVLPLWLPLTLWGTDRLFELHWGGALGYVPAAALVIVLVGGCIASRLTYLGVYSGHIPGPIQLVRVIVQSVKCADRRLPNIVSLILFALVLLAWIRSYWRAEILTVPVPRGSCVRVSSCAGIIMLEHWFSPGKPCRCRVDSDRSESFMDNYRSLMVSIGFNAGKRSVGDDQYGFYPFRTGRWSLPQLRYTSLNLPYWLFAVPFGILPCRGLVRGFLRARRLPTDACQTCGYSLTGNLSGVCPECGTAVLGR